MVFGMAFLGGLIFGVSYGVSRLSEVTLADLSLDGEQISEVAGTYIEKIDSPIVDKLIDTSGTEAKKDAPKEKPLFTLALLSDSHNDNENLKKALSLVKEKGVTQLVFLGDYTAVGSIPELESAKATMDASGLTYYSIPGDHDLWKSSGVTNFTQVFGKRYQKVQTGGITLLLLDNSDNSDGVDKEQLDWFVKELQTLDKEGMNFVVISNPLHNTNGLGKLMGENDEEVESQAKLLLSLIREAPVKAVFSGDNHLSGKYTDPVKEDLLHIGVGAITAISEARNLQTPRFDYLHIYKDGRFEVEEIVL